MKEPGQATKGEAVAPPQPDNAALALALLDSFVDGVIHLDENWHVSYLNSSAEGLLRRSRDELLGQNFWSTFAGLGATPLGQAAQHAMHEGHQHTLTALPPPFPPGTEARVARGAGGGVVFFLRTWPTDPTNDLTPLRERAGLRAAERAVRRLEKSCALLGTLIDEAPVGIGFWDDQLRYRIVNRALAEINGFSPEHHLGKTVAELLPGLGAEVIAAFRHVFLTGQSFRHETSGYTNATPNVLRSWQVSYYPVMRHEAIVGVGAICEELTEKKRYLNALEQSEAQLRQLTENLPDLAWSARPDGHIDYYNQRWYEYTGTTFEHVGGWGWQHVHDPTKIDEILNEWRQGLATGQPFEMEFRLRGADGVFRWFLTRVRPLYDDYDNLVRWFGTNTNIDWRKQAETEREDLIAALARSNAELDEFAYVVSHDLKAPLRALTNLARWIEEDLGDAVPQKVQTHVHLLQKRAQQLGGLIDGVLRYTKAGRGPQPPEQLDVKELLVETIELLAPPANVRVLVDVDVKHVQAERTPLQQVMLNLLSNALTYGARPDLVISLRAGRCEGGWEFSVCDNGPGISPRFHEHIWGVFQTLEAPDGGEGTGIGLSIVKKIVETRGGRVKLISEEGAGANFIVFWPEPAPGHRPLSASHQTPPVQTPTSSPG